MSKETFKTLKGLIKKSNWDKNRPLTKDVLSDPYHVIVKTLLYIYSMEPAIYKILNKASREKDKRRVAQLGPYSDCLRIILANAERNRKDKIPMGKAFTVYRGFCMNDEGINEYRKMKGKKAGINLRGFTSTTLAGLMSRCTID